LLKEGSRHRISEEVMRKRKMAYDVRRYKGGVQRKERENTGHQPKAAS